MIRLLIITTIVLEGNTASNPVESNFFMDNLLRSPLGYTVRRRGLEPKRLPDFQTSFFERFYAVPTEIQTEYSWGRLTGIAQTVRSQDCTSPRWNYDRSGNATLNCTLRFPQLRVEYTAWVKSPVTSFRALADLLDTEVRVEVTKNRDKSIPYLKKLDVLNIGVMAPVFQNIGQRFEQLFARNLTRTFCGQVAVFTYETLAKEFSDAFAEAITYTRNMPMP